MSSTSSVSDTYMTDLSIVVFSSDKDVFNTYHDTTPFDGQERVDRTGH